MMKTALYLIFVLFSANGLAQDGELPNKEPVRGPHKLYLVQDLGQVAQAPGRPGKPQPTAVSRSVSLEIQGNNVLTLDPACNACKGAPITLQVHNKSSHNVPLLFTAGEITSKPEGKPFNAKVSFTLIDRKGQQDSKSHQR